MSLLLVSIAMLWFAPLLYHWASRYGRMHRAVERVLLIALAGFVVVGIIPQSFEKARGWTILLALVGMLLPSLAERMWHRLAHKVHWVPLMVGTVGLATHAAIDGMAFIDPFHARSDALSVQLVVIVHRFFEGLFIWWALRPKFGWEVAAAVLGFSGSFTFVGYLAGGWWFQGLGTDMGYALFQALVGGSLLHLAIDRHDGRGGHEHGIGHGSGDHDHEHAHEQAGATE